jgi:hypothetical protein
VRLVWFQMLKMFMVSGKEGCSCSLAASMCIFVVLPLFFISCRSCCVSGGLFGSCCCRRWLVSGGLWGKVRWWCEFVRFPC